MSKHSSRRAGWAALVGGLTVALGLASDDPKARQDPAGTPHAPTAGRGRTSGVILKVEPLGDPDPGRRQAYRLTVNTDVVWRDFVRDQATEPKKAARMGTAKAAEKGKSAVATEGHPKSDPLLAVVELDGRTEITVRFRSSTDSISDGATTAEGAAAVEDAADNTRADRPAGREDKGKGSEGEKGPKARVLEPMELKPGLWVEVDSRLEEQPRRARRVLVIRPVGGPDVSPGKEKVPATRKVTPAS